MRSRWTLLGIPLVAGLTLAACGDSQEAAGPEADPTFVSQTESPGAGAEDGAAGENGGTGEDGEADAGTEGNEPELREGPSGTLVDPDGQEVGSVRLSAAAGAMEVEVEVTGLPPGFHGLHVHTVGVCEPDSESPDDPAQTGDFLSAGGHLNLDGSDHGDHAGDLPSLYVAESGEGRLVTRTDRFTEQDLFDTDGAALIVHSDRDNFAHIPEKYGAPDDATLRTGDAGDRIACAVLEE